MIDFIDYGSWLIIDLNTASAVLTINPVEICLAKLMLITLDIKFWSFSSFRFNPEENDADGDDSAEARSDRQGNKSHQCKAIQICQLVIFNARSATKLTYCTL